MLSEPSEKSPMTYPNYEMSCWDHRVALICVSAIGSSLTEEKFEEVRQKLSEVKKITPVTTSLTRTGSSVFYDPGQGAAEGGDPSQHCFRLRYVTSYPIENNDWGEFQKHRQVLGLISVGAYTSMRELEELKRLHVLNHTKYSSSVLDSRLIAIGLKAAAGSEEDGLEGIEEAHLEENVSNILFYQETHYDTTLQADMEDFCAALFWILESKRVEELQKEGKQDRLTLLSTPFEKKDFVGLDLESRANKKRTFGRYRKNLGDLCLLCDKMVEAYKHYEVAIETLKSCSDWIWLASALEGICAISTILTYADPDTETMEPAQAGEGIDRLKPKDIVEKYKEIVVHYSKYRQAGVIETEASVKAVHVLTEQKNFVVAAEFLQNLVFINLNMNDHEKIHRFAALSRLYLKIGFQRKAAFFLRVAAMRCVAPQNPHPNWQMCYSLLMEANFGYSLDLGKQHGTRRCGWPTVQIQVMMELVGTARRMGHYNYAVIHLTHLIEEMFDFLSENEMLDIVKQLNVLVPQIREPLLNESLGLPNPGGRFQLKYSGLKKVPTVSSFSLNPLPSYLTPKPSIQKSKGSVFFFTPKQFGGNKESDNKLPFCWVQDDVAEVCLMLSNPLPTEVKIVNLVLTYEGPKFEAFPSTFSLMTSNEKIPISLLGIPKESGLLRITGYSCTVLGVPSSCKLGDLSGNFPADGYIVEVVPKLPLLQGGTFKGIGIKS